MRWLILLLLLTACAEEAVIPTATPPENKAETPPEPAAAPVEPDIPQPLDSVLVAERRAAELELETTFTCRAVGGSEPYAYVWHIEGKEFDCTESDCSFSFHSIGNYTVNCTVTAGGERVSKAVTVAVLKEQLPIQSVIAFGDSLTFGEGLQDPFHESWVVRYTSTLRSAALFNYAISGATTYGVLEQLKEYEMTKQDGTKLIFLWVGANDIKHLISLEDFSRNYRAITEQLVDEGSLVLITIPDVAELPVAADLESEINQVLAAYGTAIPVRTIGKEVINAYNRMIVEVGIEYELPVIDMFTYMESVDPALISDDLFHPNAAGHAEIAKVVAAEIEEQVARISFI